MKFYNYLNENENMAKEKLDEYLSTIRKDCKKILQTYKLVRRFIYRGTDKLKDDDFIKVKPRKSRRPKDTSYEVHITLDSFFERRFGWKARSEGVFTTPMVSKATKFGKKIGIIFPKDGFDFLWNPRIMDSIHFETEKRLNRSFTEQLERYRDDNLVGAIQQESEIIFRCDYFYLINRYMEIDNQKYFIENYLREII